MERRIFSREFKVEAFRLVQVRGVSIAQASRDLDLNDNVLRPWIREMSSDPSQAFPGHGQIKADEREVEKLRRDSSTFSFLGFYRYFHLSMSGRSPLGNFLGGRISLVLQELCR